MTTEVTPGETIPTPDPAQAAADANVKVLLANPSMIPSKFRMADGGVNVDALTQSYLQSEKALRGQTVNPHLQVPNPDGTAAPVAPVPSPDSTSVTVPDALSLTPTTGTPAETLGDALVPTVPEGDALWEAVGKEFAETGTLTEESVLSLRQSGVPDNMIHGFVQGQQIKMQQDMQKALEMVGGQDELNATMAWAQQNLSDAEKAALKPALNGPTSETVLMGLHARRVAAGVAAPQPINTGPTGLPAIGSDAIGAIKPYHDAEEMQADMRDPKYRTDPEHRLKVERRMAAGAGIDPRGLQTPS